MLYHLELESADGLRGVKEHVAENPPEVYTSSVPKMLSMEEETCVEALSRSIREYGMVGIIGKSPYGSNAVLVTYREVVS